MSAASPAPLACDRDRDRDRELRAGRALYYSAAEHRDMGYSADEWQDCLAPQWALDAVSQARVTHLRAYIWGES